MRRGYGIVLLVAIVFVACEKDNNEVGYGNSNNNEGATTTVNPVVDELKFYAPTKQNFTVDATNSFQFLTTAGNEFTFPEKSFLKNGNPVKGNVIVEITEITKKSEMIFADVLTNSEDGPLESYGEFEINVHQNGIELELASGINYSVYNSNYIQKTGVGSWYLDHSDRRSRMNNEQAKWTIGDTAQKDRCTILTELKDELFKTDRVTNTQKITDIINVIKALTPKSIRDQLNRDSSLINIINNDFPSEYGHETFHYNFTHDCWIYELVDERVSTQVFNEYGKGGDHHYDMSNLKVNDVPTWNGAFYFLDDCRFFLSGNGAGIHNQINDSLFVQFNSLSWCNIDRLITKYGQLLNCKLTCPNVPESCLIRFVFKSLNGVIPCNHLSGDEFQIDRLPNGMTITVVLYYKDGNEYKYDMQDLTASKNMVFDTSNLKTVSSIAELKTALETLDQ